MKNWTKYISVFIFLMIYNSAIWAQPIRPPGQINWMSIQQAAIAFNQAPKKIFVDVYTDWCGWCKKMDATTFKDADVADYINSNYYPIKLNAEMKDSIIFNQKLYKFNTQFRAHELALSWLNQKMSYPSYVFLNEQWQVLSPVPGYQKKEALMPILKYFGDNIYLNKSWVEYSQEL